MTVHDYLLGAHAGATLTMTGVIWLIQLVHYPLFARVGREAFTDYHRAHTAQITWLVGPLMLLELATAVWITIDASVAVPALWRWVGLALLGLIWLSTAVLQIPQHSRLGRGFDKAVIRRLVLGNWLRTVAWTLRGILSLGFLLAAG